MTSVKKGLPPGLVSNLQEVLSSRKGGVGEQSNDGPSTSSTSAENAAAGEGNDDTRPIVLVTNGDGIDSPGLLLLVEALVREGSYNVHVCAPQLDKSASGHSVTLGETIAATSAQVSGATAYEISGTPVDCVSLALSGALFSWSKPVLVGLFMLLLSLVYIYLRYHRLHLQLHLSHFDFQVISGINKGSSCGHHLFYSGVVAGAREALISGFPSLSISLNWKKDESQESDFKDAVAVCLPLINAALRDIEKGDFPKRCSLNIQIPTSPSTNKGFKLTKQSMWRSTLNWNAISANRHPGAGYMSNQQSLGLQLAQLSRDASAAIAVTPLSLSPHIEPEMQTAASEWISSSLQESQ
ncbi:unnamed protein product [Linum tenue]|uniref:Survival protein SurE-like phosphatase/nucleotidase domain-containing protein n=1 Tax=Linum tenue TaxID=586396 RepID=A0AAV0PQE8_9ROSI|nr:unnamed protein product [Linum tenue]